MMRLVILYASIVAYGAILVQAQIAHAVYIQSTESLDIVLICLFYLLRLSLSRAAMLYQ